jgi:hypothetical protein
MAVLLAVVVTLALMLAMVGQFSVAAQGEVVPAAITDTPTPTPTPTPNTTTPGGTTPGGTTAPVAIPEPLTIILFGGGVAALSAAAAAKRRQE